MRLYPRSSVIQWFEYKDGVLSVQYKEGNLIRYAVDAAFYQKFLTTPSKGSLIGELRQKPTVP